MVVKQHKKTHQLKSLVSLGNQQGVLPVGN